MAFLYKTFANQHLTSTKTIFFYEFFLSKSLKISTVLSVERTTQTREDMQPASVKF